MAKRKIDLLNNLQKDDYSKTHIRRKVQEATQQPLKRIESNFLSLSDSNSLNSVHENVPSGKKEILFEYENEDPINNDVKNIENIIKENENINEEKNREFDISNL